MEKPKFFYKRFIDDKRIYNLCQGYWNKVVKKALVSYNLVDNEGKADGFLFPNLYGNGKKIYDGNPILCYVNLNLGRSIRIIVIPESEYEDEENSVLYQFTPWREKRSYHVKGLPEPVEVDELVLSLFMTKFSMEYARQFIDYWLNPELRVEEGNSQREDLENTFEETY